MESDASNVPDTSVNEVRAPEPPIYTDMPVFWQEVGSMNTTDYEGKVAGLWNFMLGHYFPSSDMFVHHPQDKVFAGYLDFNSSRWVPRDGTNDREELHFLVTQCHQNYEERLDLTIPEDAKRIHAHLVHIRDITMTVS
ncbi:hypothetical protein ASPZODRAFT_16201 [Penicilliopsis zonata CBS 506.65]|uniref:Uncharacterized protein n=1 Tax=Penicilliopsis zonata CBS 506.65 TaxID=1073090 RepID=A0A1L9SGS5_9EURO|nr:hypothetical protein ASPZODRAFT_16201 [Penicilliopsis zonata CBS 506.65]OJJ46440.1 hypothetical protein ASPZODRAFT_16201 [Penicilliopsis zonata CBS 506.65]